jgi:3-hydroxyacyl-CoA dehydrogenase/enoyl-CoA hydratase/3-hydroxybutyryl-CoA epimerase
MWFQLNEIKKGKRRPNGYDKHSVEKVGILGAGMMGAGIAYATAKSGIQVVLKDVDVEMAQKGKAHCIALLEKQVKRGQMAPEQRDEIAARIVPTNRAEDLSGCELIIEAVFEDRELKAKVTKEAEAQLEASAFFASNTSTLPITGLAEASVRPEKFIGLHFFSPVDKMQLVEIILGKKTDPETLAKAFDYVQQIKKVPIVVNDSRGFYTSRVFEKYLLEGLSLVGEGQHPRAIESAALQAGLPVGPLAVLDEVSLRLMWEILEQTRRDLEAQGMKFPEHPGLNVVDTMVNQLDRHGKKAGRGFYNYPKDGKKFLWEGLEEAFPRAEQQLSQDEMISRLMFAQVLEAVQCLEEDVVTNTGDANIGSIFGWGFAPFKGGVIQYINDYGVQGFAERAQRLADDYGPRFKPGRLLMEKAELNQLFD